MIVIVAAIAATGCAAPSDGKFAGQLTTTQGACGLGFDGQGHSTATLIADGTKVLFAPTDGVTTLPGTIDAAGHVAAGLNTTGADKKPFPQAFEGTRDGDTVRGSFATPRCRATAVLRRR